jgi:hypothetical protein
VAKRTTRRSVVSTGGSRGIGGARVAREHGYHGAREA